MHFFFWITIAERLELVNILDQAADKRTQGQSVGLFAVLMAIHRDTDPGSRLAFLDWYPQTILPELAKLPPEKVNHQDLLRSLDYWDDQAIGKAESARTLAPLALPDPYAQASSALLHSGLAVEYAIYDELVK